MDENILSWPFFDDVHRTFAHEFQEWTLAELRYYEDDEGGDGKAARTIFQLLGKNNWLKASNTERRADKGARHHLRTIALMREILAYKACIADIAFSEPWLGIMPIVLFGTQEAKREVIDGYLRGKILPAFALSEPNTGSDAAAMETKAELKGGCYTISGQKTWISNAGLADLYVVFARTNDTPGGEGISAFLVDGSLPGIRLEERLPVMSPHTVGTLHFDSVIVSFDRVLGKPGQGFNIAKTVLEVFRPTVGAAALGLARRAMDEAVSRSMQRITFGKPISQHQLIQAKLADMALKVEASALLVYRTAWSYDELRSPITREGAMAKLYATEAAQAVIDQAQQIFGGLGVLRGTVAERLYRHIRAFRIFDGTSEIQKLIIARDLLKAYH